MSVSSVQPFQRLQLGLMLGLVWLLGACDGDVSNAPGDSSVDAVSVGSGLRLQTLLGEEGNNTGYLRASPERRIAFPQDHGPHPGFRSEWWYLTLMLEDDNGSAYGGQFTLFRQALAPAEPATSENPWRTGQVYLAHLAMTDAARDDHRFAERLARGQPELAGAQSTPFAAWLEDWRLASVGETFLPMQLNAGGADFHWSLDLDSSKPLVLQGNEGFSAKGPGQGSHYYSATRLQVRGSLTVDEREIPVQGTGWLDREWSTSVLSAEQVGWDWFALQLDDGRDLMMFNLRRADCSPDPFDHGVLVGADGSYRTLRADDYELQPVGLWAGPGHRQLQPPAPGCAQNPEQRTWPLEWSVRVGEEKFLVRAAVLDQRMQTTVPYWEGLVEVYLASAPEVRVGRGYMELTGY